MAFAALAERMVVLVCGAHEDSGKEGRLVTSTVLRSCYMNPSEGGGASGVQGCGFETSNRS